MSIYSLISIYKTMQKELILVVLFLVVVCKGDEESLTCTLGCNPGYRCCDGSRCYYDNGLFLYHNCVEGGGVDANECCYSWTALTWFIFIACFAIFFGIIACCVACWVKRFRQNTIPNFYGAPGQVPQTDVYKD